MDFRKAFFPTEEEKQKQIKLIQSISTQEKEFWLSKGLSELQCSLIMEKERNEFNLLHPFQEYTPRRVLIESGIISLDDVLKEI